MPVTLIVPALRLTPPALAASASRSEARVRSSTTSPSSWPAILKPPPSVPVIVPVGIFFRLITSEGFRAPVL